MKVDFLDSKSFLGVEALMCGRVMCEIGIWSYLVNCKGPAEALARASRPQASSYVWVTWSGDNGFGTHAVNGVVSAAEVDWEGTDHLVWDNSEQTNGLYKCESTRDSWDSYIIINGN